MRRSFKAGLGDVESIYSKLVSRFTFSILISFLIANLFWDLIINVLYQALGMPSMRYAWSFFEPH